MCLLCVEIAKDNMTSQEVARAYVESDMANGDHVGEIMAEIYKHRGKEGLEDIGKEISKEYERKDLK